MIYTVTCNPALDYIMRLPKLVPNQVNRTESEQMFYGGKGINVSIVLSHLSVENVALGFVAGFTGREIADGVKHHGVQTDFIMLEEGMSRINLKIKGTTGKEETEINAQGPDIPESKLQELYEKLERITKDDTLVLSGSIPGSLPEDMYEQMMKRLQKKELRIVVDATGELLKKVLKYHPFLIKPNKEELGEFFAQKLESEEEIVACAKQLQKAGAKNVLVSMAAEGSILVAENQMIYKMGVAKGTVRNSVGAGDSMVAGFLAGYLKKKDYAYALKLGTAAGGATAFSDDLATKEAIETILQSL